MRNEYIKECSAIQQNCTYTAETHHIIAKNQRWLSIVFQIVPAIAAAILGVLVGIGEIPLWCLWLSVVSAVVAAVGNVLNPLKEYYDHLNAAKNFVALKHDARGLRDTFNVLMNDSEFVTAVKALHDQYNDLIRFAPPTDDGSFAKAQKRVQQGIHELD